MLKRFLLLLGMGLLLGNAELEALFAPDAELWPRWQKHNPATTYQVNHGEWDRFLAKFRSIGADGIARVDYKAVTAEDKALLDGYLSMLQDIPVTMLNRNQQYAYWVNFYNALTVQTILDYYPVGSIRDIDISPGLFAGGPWDAELATVEGVPLTLNDIEHRILRPIWKDPRTHYVLNCAALGCPDLPPRALTAKNRPALVEEAARNFINHPRAVRMEDGKLRLNSIYAWFRKDFGDDLIAHLNRYRETPVSSSEKRVYAYDWALNDVAR